MRSGGTIAQYGIYKPWFYRQAYDPPKATVMTC